MLAFVHLIVGAAIGTVVGSWPLAFAAGFLSHFLLDALPHTDSGTLKNPEERGTMKLNDLVVAGVDLAIALGIMAWLVRLPEFSASMVAGAFGGLVPDFAHPAFHVMPNLRTQVLTGWYYRFHRAIQGTVDKPQWVRGVMIELVVAAIALIVIVR
jgi:hypothetical protein